MKNGNNYIPHKMAALFKLQHPLRKEPFLQFKEANPMEPPTIKTPLFSGINIQQKLASHLPTLLFLLFSFILIPLNPVHAQKASILCKPVDFKNKNLKDNFKAYEVYEIPVNNILEVKEKQQQFNFLMKFGNKHVLDLNLYESGIMGPNYREIVGTTNGPVVLPHRENISYFGYSNPGGLEVAITIDKDWIMGFVTKQNGQRYFIEPLSYTVPGADKKHFLFYRAEDIINPENVNCGYIETEKRAPSLNEYGHDIMHDDHGSDKMLACHVVDFSVASTFDMINAAHNSAALVMNHVVSITTMMAVFYSYHTINFQINENYVAASAANDPLLPVSASANVDILLPNFMAWAQAGGFGVHDLGQMWTARDIFGCGGTNNFGLVGCAYIGGTCGNFRYNVCEDFAPANLGYTAILSAHEIGHNFNALHSDSDPAPNNIMDGFLSPTATGFGPMSRAKIDGHADGPNGTCLGACPTPIPNDNCGNATPISCGATVTGSTVGANTDGPNSCAGTAPDVWYTIVGTGGNITASMCSGTVYDSALDVYTGTCNSLSLVTCNDDFCSAFGPAQVTWASTLGITYRIRVYGFIGSTGSFSLSITCPATLTCPQNTTVAACQTQNQVNSAFAAWLATATATGSGCGGTLSNNSQGAPSACGGSTTVTFTFTSTCAPSQSCQATFTVAPAPAVILTCPVNTTVSACLTQAQLNTAYAAWLASATASGGCNGVLTNNSPGTPLICSQTAIVRTVTFTYASGCAPLTTSCTATFTVPAYPDFTVPANTASQVACPSQIVQPIPPVVFDGCGKPLSPTGPVIVNNPNPITCEGTRTFTWTYTDCSGRAKTWSHVTTVEREPFGVPANGGATVACPDQTDTQPTPPVVTSHCGEVLTPVITSTAKPGCEGNRNWNFKYTDCEGNTATWVFIYTVEYLDFTVPPSETVNVECPLNASQPVPPVVKDNCGITLTPTGPAIASSTNAWGCEGSRSYTWTYKDCEGNTHTWGKTFNFQYTADFFVYPDGEDFVACVGYAQPPIPPAIYDNCGQLIKVTGPTTTQSISALGCSGWRKFSYVYTDCGGHSHPWTYTYYINDNQAPLGACQSSGGAGGPVSVNVSNLSCLADVPCPDDYDFSGKVEELLLAGNFFDVCSGDDLVVTLDSYTDIWDCSDPDGDGNYTFGQTFYFHIADPCGNAYPDLCAVTYSGKCLPIQSFAQKDWGNEGGLPGSNMGITDLAIIQNLLLNGSTIKVGGPNRSITINDAQCVMDMLPATGGPNPLKSCHQTNCTGCNPMYNGGLHNSLAGGMIALNLNLRFSNTYNGVSMSNLLNQNLGCIEVHPCIQDCDGGTCQLRIFDDADNEYTFPYTLGGLMDLTNLYLDGNLSLGNGLETLYGTALNQAVGAANTYWSANGAFSNACNPDLKPGDGSDKMILPGSNAVSVGSLEFNLAPNPTRSEVAFRLSELEAPQTVTFEIYNYLGQRLLHKDFGVVRSVNERIDLSGIGTGLYIVRVKAGEEHLEKKLVVNQ